jgi:hypothetical protein
MADLLARRSREIDFVVNNMHALRRDLEDVGTVIGVQAAIEIYQQYHNLWAFRLRSMFAECLYACVVRTVRLSVPSRFYLAV